MAWFKVDDKLHSHPKVVDVPLRAMGLWVKAGAWCSDQLTDGVIPKSVVTMLGASRADAVALVKAGLWEETASGYVFHDWLEQNPSRDSVQQKRRQGSERIARWRAKQSTTEAPQ